LRCFYSNHTANITIHPEGVNDVVGGTTAFLSCVAFGHPFPDIVWTRLGSNFSNASEFTVSRSLITVNKVTLAKSTLKVCRIQEADPNLFTCTANTGYGSDSTDFRMNVQSIGGMLSVSIYMSQVKCRVIRSYYESMSSNVSYHKTFLNLKHGTQSV